MSLTSTNRSIYIHQLVGPFQRRHMAASPQIFEYFE